MVVGAYSETYGECAQYLEKQLIFVSFSPTTYHIFAATAAASSTRRGRRRRVLGRCDYLIRDAAANSHKRRQANVGHRKLGADAQVAGSVLIAAREKSMQNQLDFNSELLIDRKKCLMSMSKR